MLNNDSSWWLAAILLLTLVVSLLYALYLIGHQALLW